MRLQRLHRLFSEEIMKLWYDDKKIPLWVEILAVLFFGVVFGIAVGLVLLGYNLAHYLT